MNELSNMLATVMLMFGLTATIVIGIVVVPVMVGDECKHFDSWFIPVQFC